jgi:hypothetical protein
MNEVIGIRGMTHNFTWSKQVLLQAKLLSRFIGFASRFRNMHDNRITFITLALCLCSLTLLGCLTDHRLF